MSASSTCPEEQREAARRYASEQAEELRRKLNLDASRLGTVEAVDELAAAVRGAWMVIEAVPDRLELKRDVFAELDRTTDPDAILAKQLVVTADEPGDRERAAPRTRSEHALPKAA